MKIIRESDGQPFEGPDGPVPAGFRVQSAALAQSPAAQAKPIDGSPGGVYRGAVADTFGLSDRPGAVRATSHTPGQKTPLGVVLSPEGPLERATSAAVTIPAYSLIPGGWAARMGLGAAQGGATALAEGKGKGEAAISALLDAAVVGATEGVVGGASRLAAYGGRAARASRFAAAAPGTALDAIRHRLPPGPIFDLPTLSPHLLSATDAIRALVQRTGMQFRAARAELLHQMQQWDAVASRVVDQGSRNVKGKVAVPFTPSRAAVASERAAQGLRSPVAHGAADAAMTQPVEPGLPAGAVGGAGVGEAPSWIQRHLMRLMGVL